MKKILLITLFIIIIFLSSCKGCIINNEYNFREQFIIDNSYQFNEFLFYNNSIIKIDYSKIDNNTLYIPNYINEKMVSGIADPFVPISQDTPNVLTIDGRNGINKIYLNEYLTMLDPIWELYEKYEFTCYEIYNIKELFIPSTHFSIVDEKTYDLDAFSNYLSLYKLCDNIYIPKLFYDFWLNDGDFTITSTDECKILYDFNYTTTISCKTLKEDFTTYIKAANVAYYYNYDGAPNNNYYFIDNSDDGYVIKPKYDPVRVGYEFIGWFTEEECINEFNFETDVLFDEIEKGYKEYKLFAKWR